MTFLMIEFSKKNNISVIRKDDKKGVPLKSDYICAIQKWTYATPVKRKFINVTNLIKDLPASKLCIGNGQKINLFAKIFDDL